jgi:hypothetical protein
MAASDFILFCQKVAKRSHSFLKGEYFVTNSPFCKFFKSPNCDRKFEFFFGQGCGRQIHV